MIALILALEPTAPADGQAPGGLNSSLFMMLGLGVVFFFLLIRPPRSGKRIASNGILIWNWFEMSCIVHNRMAEKV